MTSSSRTFNLYTFTTFLKWLVAMVLGLSFVIFLVDLVELLRRTSSIAEVTLMMAAYMSLLRVPELLMEVLPILVLFAVIGALWWRSRSHELIVARATGLSLWQFLKPITVTSFLFGTLVVGAFHPIALLSSQKLQVLEDSFFGRQNTAPVLRISTTGIWLREPLGESSYRLVRSRQVVKTDVEATLTNVDVFIVSENADLLVSWHADQLIFTEGNMALTGVMDQTDPDVPRPLADQNLTTTLDLNSLYKQNKIVEDVNFWQMPKLVKRLREAGVSYREVELKYVKLISLPFVLVSMVFLAALFSLRMTRSGGVGKMILAGVSIALILHFLTDILYSFALAGSLPILLAVAVVPFTLTCVCSFFLLGQEDG